MTSEFKNMLHLFACGASNTTPHIEKCNVDETLKLAKQQGVLEMVMSAMLHLDGDFEEFKKMLAFGVFQNTRNIHFLHNKVKMLEENGIECCVLKGVAYAHMYPNRELRRSGDVDILINPKDEQKALQILKDEGFSYKERHSTYNETVCVHENGGVLEVHISPYDDLRDKILFKNEVVFNEPYRKMKALDTFDITVMGVTDGLIFNVLHSMKHFLSSGVGIRQIMDVLMYMKYYKEEIDWERFYTLIVKLKYRVFIDSCIGIGIKYLGFEKDRLPCAEYCDEKVEKLLCDIENGGLFGYNDYERTKFYAEYLSRTLSSNNEKNPLGESYLKGNVLKKLFPKVIALYRRYPYSYKCKALIPVAWVHRIVDYIFKKHEKTKSAMYEERMKLLKSLDMI